MNNISNNNMPKENRFEFEILDGGDNASPAAKLATARESTNKEISEAAKEYLKAAEGGPEVLNAYEEKQARVKVSSAKLAEQKEKFKEGVEAKHEEALQVDAERTKQIKKDLAVKMQGNKENAG
jgi:hypothetical protein